MRQILFEVFISKLKNALFRESTKFYFLNFFSVLTFKTIDTQMLSWSVFFKTHTKTLLTAKNEQNGVFMVNNFFFVRFKSTDKKNICVSIVLKVKSEPKHKDTNIWGVFL